MSDGRAIPHVPARVFINFNLPQLFYSSNIWMQSYFDITLVSAFTPPSTLPFSPQYPNITATNSSSQHPGGLNVLMADGSVRFVKNTVDSWPTNLPSDGYRAWQPRPRGLAEARHAQRG